MSLKLIIARQLKQPNGFLGKIVGYIMNKNNAYMNRLTIETLNIHSDESILEIGFGNGKYITEVAKQASKKL